MTFHVGQRVVCIDDDWCVTDRHRPWVHSVPVLNGIYTIREILKSDRFGRSLRFIEIVNPLPPWDAEARFNVEHFRPLIERKTDISIFTEMLTPKQRERTDA